MRCWLALLLILFITPVTAQSLSKRQQLLLQGARSTLGDVYDAGYYGGGPPPQGRGACPEVVYYAYLKAGQNLQDLLDQDLRANPALYPNRRDRNIDYRWCPNLIVWFRRHSQMCDFQGDWKAGDVVFFSLLDDGTADHVGIVSDRKNRAGRPLVIHNLGPRCSEDDVLGQLRIVGHFR